MRYNIRFAEKIVLVTGASRNTGLEIASRFSAEGATVRVLYKNSSNSR